MFRACRCGMCKFRKLRPPAGGPRPVWPRRESLAKARPMRGLTSDEAAAVERCAGEPMLAQVEAWAAVNSGSRNLEGLGRIGGMLADAFAALPGALTLRDPSPLDAVTAHGRLLPPEHGPNL